jgi:hypothetical protein
LSFGGKKEKEDMHRVPDSHPKQPSTEYTLVGAKLKFPMSTQTKREKMTADLVSFLQWHVPSMPVSVDVSLQSFRHPSFSPGERVRDNLPPAILHQSHNTSCITTTPSPSPGPDESKVARKEQQIRKEEKKDKFQS